jgi:transposase-like protein
MFAWWKARYRDELNLPYRPVKASCAKKRSQQFVQVKLSSRATQLAYEVVLATRRKFSADEKIRILLEGLRGEAPISEICRREGIASSVYYKWSKAFVRTYSFLASILPYSHRRPRRLAHKVNRREIMIDKSPKKVECV